jgi:hypothetical protein
MQLPVEIPSLALFQQQGVAQDTEEGPHQVDQTVDPVAAADTTPDLGARAMLVDTVHKRGTTAAMPAATPMAGEAAEQQLWVKLVRVERMLEWGVQVENGHLEAALITAVEVVAEVVTLVALAVLVVVVMAEQTRASQELLELQIPVAGAGGRETFK